MNLYRPSSFAVDDQELLFDAMERHSFATLVGAPQSDGDSVIDATHTPLLLDRQQGQRGVLFGHLARANDFWTRLEGCPLLSIFHGPHTYISPRWYEHNNLVPTWNYVVVHVRGRFRRIDDRQRTLDVVRRFVDHYEKRASQPWSIDLAEASLIDSLLDAIVAFEIPIEQLSGKWKLSQNHSPERRRGVVEGLLEQGDENARAIAQLMQVGLDSDPS